MRRDIPNLCVVREVSYIYVGKSGNLEMATFHHFKINDCTVLKETSRLNYF